MKKSLITGISGQDGALLAELLLSKNHKVLGGIRNPRNTWRLEALGILDKIEFIEFDYAHPETIQKCIQSCKPDEVYNLAAQSSVAKSFHSPIETAMVDAMGVVYLLDNIHKYSPHTKYFQAGSCEMFGNSDVYPQGENTVFKPINPYSSAKVYAYNLTKNYREAFSLFAVNGILFNHESEWRGNEFFTRRVSMHVAGYSLGKKGILDVGNIHAIRDIGYAKDFVEAVYLCLQADIADDYVIATGTCSRIKDFIEYCYQAIGVNLRWEGQGKEEKAYHEKTGELLVRVNPANFRPTDILKQMGDPRKINEKLSWKANMQLSEIVERMVRNDIELLKS